MRVWDCIWQWPLMSLLNNPMLADFPTGKLAGPWTPLLVHCPLVTGPGARLASVRRGENPGLTEASLGPFSLGDSG